MTDRTRYPRRQFLKQTALGGAALSGMGGILYSRQAPALITSDDARPNASWGLQIGDVTVSVFLIDRTVFRVRGPVPYSPD
jgi:phosphodiesterase/alkaline phosphatase D-like protein